MRSVICYYELYNAMLWSVQPKEDYETMKLI